ncbi:hypothetical protein [Sphingobacterium lumbrici]|nr:hypothetical protein [Sphingobacterium lumbrici]
MKILGAEERSLKGLHNKSYISIIDTNTFYSYTAYPTPATKPTDTSPGLR